MPEDTTNPIRSGSSTQGDAFTKREQASEDMYIRQREMEKLQAMKAKKAKEQAQSQVQAQAQAQAQGGEGK